MKEEGDFPVKQNSIESDTPLFTKRGAGGELVCFSILFSIGLNIPKLID